MSSCCMLSWIPDMTETMSSIACLTATNVLGCGHDFNHWFVFVNCFVYDLDQICNQKCHGLGAEGSPMHPQHIRL